MLIKAPVLVHCDPNKESRVETNASDGVIAGVFSQLGADNEWHPVLRWNNYWSIN